MIPKAIHYCWFGKNEKPNEILNYIETWKLCCPDYEIREWNEDNFDIHSNRYVEQAYESKKWAFVTDYVRLYAIYNYGGIYMDTDVEVVRSFDEFLQYSGFTGFEIAEHPLTGTMACEKGNPLIGKVLDSYRNRLFIKEDGSFDLTTNIIPFRDVCYEYGYKMNNQLQIIDNFAIYPSDFFCAYNFEKKEFEMTKNTCTVHHFAGSWIPKSQKLRRSIRKILGNNISNKLVSLLKKR